jgi:hypothetical protein
LVYLEHAMIYLCPLAVEFAGLAMSHFRRD